MQLLPAFARRFGRFQQHTGRRYTQNTVTSTINSPASAFTCTVVRDNHTLGPKPDFLREGDEKHFDFTKLELQIYQWWQHSDAFKPPPGEDMGATKSHLEPFVVSMPPPNVTGHLHMGHAMFIALQDIMCRFQRMRGRPTLWLPGTDHAGIATQLLVERSLHEQGTSRTEIGRAAFLEKVWEWKADKGGYITSQMRRLGASADWSREKFTLDAPMSAAVIEAFVHLHERGLIYRGDYMVSVYV